ncbi:MAG TPA: MBL fold metallo-hydrolase, partial [Thermodesulfobacteriota bacterium]|nr:MBL fold metallo-hydrolase [Thermodesulfobacteriota bacterium]
PRSLPGGRRPREEEVKPMSQALTRRTMLSLLAGLAAAPLARAGRAALAGEAPPYETRRLVGDVYIFRYLTHQSMFVATPDGVIATDPISSAAAPVYLQEIRKVTAAPVRYVVYSHHHFDHIAGGRPFRDAGALFVAHRRARERLASLAHPEVVLPDLVVEERGRLALGGTELELLYVGRNHTDNSLVMLLPKERVLFAVDFLPIRELPFRNMPDSYVREWFTSIDRVLELEWDRMIAGHPRQGGVGTKADVRALKEYLTDLSEAVRQAAAEGKCFERAMQEVRLPKYESWGRYAEFLPGNVERLCYYWRNGWE